MADEAFGCAAERGVECGLACGEERLGLPEVALIRRHQADACMMMIFVTPCEESSAEGFGVTDVFKPGRKFRLIFQRLEVRLRERVVV